MAKTARMTIQTTDLNPWSQDAVTYGGTDWNYGLTTDDALGTIGGFLAGEIYQVVFNCQVAYLGGSPGNRVLMLSMLGNGAIIAQCLIRAADLVLAGDSGQWATGLSDQDAANTGAAVMSELFQCTLPLAKVSVVAESWDTGTSTNVGEWKISAFLSCTQIVHP